MDSWLYASLSGGSTPVAAQSFTWAARPAAAGRTGQFIRITDVSAGQSGTGGGALFISNGIRWKPINGEVIVDGIDTPNVGLANTTEQVLTATSVVQPAGLIGDYDKLSILLTASKSGTSDTCTLRLRWGPLGTVADPILTQITTLAGASQTFANLLVFKRVTATTIQKMGNGAPDGGYSGSAAATFPAAIAVSSMDSNGMRLTITAQMTNGTEIPTIQDMRMTLVSSDNS